ncbi:MAG: hypothetical protein ACOCVA_07075 [Prolixibacteraceae bacterium]
MDLKELKKTWNNLDTGKELDENQIRAMLEKRTGNLLERIDRNIKIGFVLVFLLILISTLDDFLFSPLLIKDVSAELAIPGWLLFLGVFSNALILTTFIYFVVKYYRVKRSCDIVCDLQEMLVKIIDTLKIYKRLFYLALVTLLFAMASGFVTGMYKGFRAEVEEQGLLFSEVPPDKLVVVILIGLGILVVTIGSIFLLLRWGFHRLYGNYISKLKLTLKELREIDE